MDLVPARCVIFSLDPILVDYAVVSAIAIAQSNCDGGDEGGREDVRSATKSGGYCAAKTAPLFKTLALSGLKHPLKPAATKRRKQIKHCVPFMQRKPRPWLVDDGRGPLKARLLEIL